MKHKREQGFALVLSLFVLSFVVLLMLSLTTLLRVESASVRHRRNQCMAREQARLGLQLALSQLQRTAGPDRCATARSDVLGAVEQSYWTGVWCVDGEMEWLVSGENQPSDDDAAFVDILSGAKSVRVPRQAVAFGDEPSVRRHYAYWVGDEGVKASLSSVDQVASSSLEDPEEQQRARFMMGTAHRIGDALASAGLGDRFNQEDVETQAALQSLSFWSGLSRVPGLDKAAEHRFLSEHYFDYSVGSAFTLTNTLDGGLRQDLSHLKRLSHGVTQAELDRIYAVPQWDYLTPELHQFVRFHERNQELELQPDVVSGEGSAQVGYATHPIVPELAINMGLGVRNTVQGETDAVYLYYYAFADILAPYTQALALKNGRGSNPDSPYDIWVTVSGLPEIEIINESFSASKTLSLPDLEFGLNSFYDHAPGYVQAVSRPSSRYRNNIAGRGVMAIPLGHLDTIPNVYDAFRIKFAEADLRIMLAEAKTHSEEPEVFQVIELSNWGGFEVDYPARGKDDRLVRGGSLMSRSHLINNPNICFGFHGKIMDEWLDFESPIGELQGLERLLLGFDMRERNLHIDLANPLAGDGAYYQVRLANELSHDEFLNGEDFFRGKFSYQSQQPRYAVLFDLPSQELISVGGLSQMHFENHPAQPFSHHLGAQIVDSNIDGDFDDADESLNNFYDRYFFSTLPTGASEWDRQSILANSKIRFWDSEKPDLESANTAQNLMLEGGFNVNSTSSLAWRAVLSGGRIPGFSYLNRAGRRIPLAAQSGGIEDHTLERAFFNQPFQADNWLEDAKIGLQYVSPKQARQFSTGLKDIGAHEAFTQGFRELSSAQIEALADAIVDEIQKFGQKKQRAFLSLTEFANSGVLKRAIDRVVDINSPGGLPIPAHSPAYVSAGTIMNFLAPMLFTRSDTFVIRAYGDVENAITGEIEARALCEARVQRIPDMLNESLGRKFVVKSFRWCEG